jgi:hypothetical protein
MTRLGSPLWMTSADRALAMAAGRIRLIRAVTPVNAAAELASLEEAVERGTPRQPSFRYERVTVDVELVRALEALAGFVEKEGPLGAIYAARARELALEAEIMDSIATPRLAKLAERRFVDAVGAAGVHGADLLRADAIARAWTDGAPAPSRSSAPELVRSCDPSDPRSLYSRMVAEVGRQKLPVRVLVEPGLASLAATGDGVILIAAGKPVGAADVARTVLHEIAGHALPRVRAASAPLGIFALGTARGIDDQEGRALLLERGYGFFDASRTSELGLRHRAARATLDGADFVEVVRMLLDRGASAASSVRIAARVQRGGAPQGGGIAREVIYLPAMLRVERAMRAEPHGGVVEAMMARGRIAAEVAPTLASALALIDGEPSLAAGF